MQKIAVMFQIMRDCDDWELGKEGRWMPSLDLQTFSEDNHSVNYTEN